MKSYVMKMEDGTEFVVSLSDDRSAVMFARRFNQKEERNGIIVDVSDGNGSVLGPLLRGCTERAYKLIEDNGFVLQKLKNAYLVESENRALLELVPKLEKIVAEDIGGYVLSDSVCLDFRANRWLYRVLFN